jgi:hypothetical protein
MQKIIIALAMFAACAAAQSKLASESEGYSFTVPRGWMNESSADGFAIVNPAKTIVIAVKAHGYRDPSAFAADVNLEREGLELVGKLQDVRGGKIFRTVKRSPQGMAVIDTAVVFSGNGGGVVVVSISDEANAATGFNTAAAIANSVEFFQPKVSAAAGQVRNLIAGKNLLYLYTASGYSERKDIYLCSSGTFYQSTNMGGFSPGDVGGPSFGASGGKSGQWSISPNGQKLMLRFQRGGTAEYQLTARQASNEIGMNGQRWFVRSQTVCR